MRKVVLPWYLVVGVLVLMVGLFAYGLHRNTVDEKSMRGTEASRVAELSRLEAEKLGLQTAIDNVGSDAFVEMYVRENLDFMKPGELRFEIANPDLLRNYREEESRIIAEELAIIEP